MQKEDWLDYFEAINGRSATEEEIAQALAAGEFQVSSESVQTPEFTVSQTNPTIEAEQSRPQVNASALASETVVSQTAAEQPFRSPAFNQAMPKQEAQYAEQTYVNPQQVQQSFGQPQGHPQQYHNQPTPVQQQFNGQGQQFGQQQYNQQAYQQQQTFQNGSQEPFGQQAQYAQLQQNQFSQTMKAFWAWLLSAWKSPTSEVETKSSNGYIALGLLSFLSGTSLYLSIFRTASYVYSAAPFHLAGSASFDFKHFFLSVLSAAFSIFSIILGGFVVKRLIYRDDSFTFNKAFDWYGRLYAIVLPIITLAVLMNLLEALALGILLNAAAILLVGIGATFALIFSKNNSNLDPFYKYLLAIVVNGVIVFICGLISMVMLSGL